MPGSIPSTPFPVGSLRSGHGKEASPAELLVYLETLIAEHLSDNTSECFPASTKESWGTIIEGLSEHFIATFPKSTSALWNALHEKVTLCSASLTVIERAALRVDELFIDTDGRSLMILHRLFILLFALQTWSTTAVPLRNNVDAPSVLRSKVVRTIGTVLQVFMSTSASESMMTQKVTEKCLTTMNGMLGQATNIIWPLEVNLLDVLKVSDSDESNVKSSIEIINPAMFCLALSDILIIAISCFENERSNFRISIAERELAVISRSLLDFFLLPELGTTKPQRSEALASLIRSVQRQHARASFGHEILSSVLTVVLLFRLREGPDAAWEQVDNALCDCFKAGTISLHPQNSSTLVLELVLRKDPEDDSQQLTDASSAAIQASLKGLDQRVLESLRRLLREKASTGAFNDILKAIDAALLPQPSVADDTVLGKRKWNEPWRRRILQILQADVFDSDEDWAPNSDLNDASWVSGVLDSLRRKPSRPLADPSPSSRLRTIVALKTAACTFAHPEEELCHQYILKNHPPLLSLIPSYVACLTYLQNGPASEVNSMVLKGVQDTLAICLRHHTQGFSEEKLDAVSELIRQGMQRQDRSTRLASGRALVELVRLYQRIGLGGGVNRRIKTVFDMITTQLSHTRDTVKETTLISLGSMGKTTDTDVLGRVLFMLFTQLDQNNILLKGVTYMQLLGLAKYHKKTPYLLISPFMEEISTYVVSIMSDRPNAMIETCRFLSLSPSDFLSVTLPYTLPRLFCNCNIAALNRIHTELGKPVSTLFMNATADILAHVFLLSNPAETEKALSFILRVLSEAAKNGKIGLSNLIKSCIVNLLGKLVIAMGDGDISRADDAMQAIRKVERALNPPLNGRHAAGQHIGNLLKGHMLGIIALLNDVLQDVQGRKTDYLKRKVLFGLNILVKEVGSSIIAVAPQIMATLQTTVCLEPLSHAALQTWHTFITTISFKDLGSHVGPTTAALVNVWPSLKPEERTIAKSTIAYILEDAFKALGEHVDDIVDLSAIPELRIMADKLQAIRKTISVPERLERILERTYSDNNTVVIQALEEFKTFILQKNAQFFQSLASGHVFDPLVGRIVKSLLTVACRDGENIEALRLLAFECLGILGAVDPDRFDIVFSDDDMIVLANFQDEAEAMRFALHLIQNTLVGAFRSTSDLKYQGHLAFAIQELLKFCKFTPDLAVPGAPVPIKVRNRWSSLPKHVLETVTPLLEGKFAISSTNMTVNVQHPIYPSQPTYREWLQLWTTFLITQASGQMAKAIFDPFRLAVGNKDVGVAHQLLPHLALNILISGAEDVAQKIRAEIVAVLEDQLAETSLSSPDKQLLSAQAIFMLMDHLNKWIRIRRQQITSKRNERKRVHHDGGLNEFEMEVTRVDSILASIDQVLIARAAFQCKSYARSLMNFEKQIIALGNAGTPRDDLQGYYDKLHEIYSHLDEPDGMEGISAYITLPSIEHQIRQHESTGRWTSAQSCWEVRLQQSPDKLDYHLGLLRCLRNLGHYDSLRTHIQGVLVRNPEWEKPLAGFRIEGAWMHGDWEVLRRSVEDQEEAWEAAIARLLLALRSSDDADFTSSIAATRLQLGIPIIAAGKQGYRRAYDAVLKLHLVRDIEAIRGCVIRLQGGGDKREHLSQLFSLLSRRLDSTLPTFRTREPILSLHRTTFTLSSVATSMFRKAVGKAWLDSAKIARKAGHLQVAYSAILQAQECQAPQTYFQSAKLQKAYGEPLRALAELENALKTTTERRQFLTQGVIDLADDTSFDEVERKHSEAKAKLLRARWMQESDRFDASVVVKELADLTKQLSDLESAHFYAGHHQDELFKTLSRTDKSSRGARMNFYTLKCYAKAIRVGSKYTYQAIPRLLSIWLDMGEGKDADNSVFPKVNEEVKKAINQTPVYKWLTAFPQIVSRVDHKHEEVLKILSKLIVTVLQEYPQQGLWLFVAVVKSTKSNREKRGNDILNQLRNNPRTKQNAVTELIAHTIAMSTELLRLCDYPIRDDTTKTLSVSKDFPSLARLAPSPLIIPLQESMIVSLPAHSSQESAHQPFPPDLPTIAAFFDEIDVMKSLAKPRKITMKGSDGKVYMFLGKPKDDLRKDARLMDFNSIINKLLRTDSEARRRRLRIRTYSVVTLNEECGFIQWVPNTTPIRPVLLKYYSARGVEPWNRDMASHFQKIKEATETEAAVIFKDKIINIFPPMFHEWFLDTFPEPTAWLSSRLAYGRTLAVMSMVGFILGLGDRHLENILLDVNSGDVVHVDFNCLFEKGKSLETPERVPFRLTNNITDGLGVTGVEGVFRNASEITLQLLRDNKDILMNVLDAFIHDPLVEWEDEKRKMERQARRNGERNIVKNSVDLRRLAETALIPIEKKLRGMYVRETNKNDRGDREISTSNLVQILIEEAMDLRNLSKMYPGWAPWH